MGRVKRFFCRRWFEVGFEGEEGLIRMGFTCLFLVGVLVILGINGLFRGVS